MLEEKELKKCPVCLEASIEASVIGKTEIWSCNSCPTVIFTYYDSEDITNLREYLTEK